MIRSLTPELDEEALRSELFALISQREDQYSEMPTLLGNDLEDELSVWRMAGSIIARQVGSVAIPALEKKVGRLAIELLELIIRAELLQGFNEMNLAPKIKNIESDI
jgi:hypothetical protein